MSVHIRKQLEVMKEVAYVTYKEWSAYRTHSIISIFAGSVYFIVQYFIWHGVYGDKGPLQGIAVLSTIIVIRCPTPERVRFSFLLPSKRIQLKITW